MSVNVPFKSLGNRDSQDALGSARRPVLLYFHDPDNRLCQLINPDVGSVTEESAPSLVKYSIDVNSNKDVSYEFNIMEAPSFVLYYRQEEVRRLTKINYDDDFKENFREFLVGDFMFPSDKFNVVEERNFFSALREWYQINLVAFMSPADPINWQLESMLETLTRENSSYLRAHLVNARTDKSLLTHYKLSNVPSLLMLDETDVIKKWHPASSPDLIREDILDQLKEMK